MTCPEVARLLGDAPRSVEYWVHRYEERGLAGLTEGERSGRPRRLDEKQLKENQPRPARQPQRRRDASQSLGWQDIVGVD